MSMTIQIILLLVVMLVLPGYLLYTLVARREQSVLRWLLRVAFTGAFIVYILLVGRWDVVSYYLRYIWLGLYVVAAVISYARQEREPFLGPDGRQRWLQLANYAITLLAALFFLGFALRGQFTSQPPVRLELPFPKGRYYVAQGGNSLIVNYAANSRSQQFALDIVELNRIGARANGIYPSDPERYVIFGRPLHSPCDGTVTAAVDGLPDLPPPERDRENPAGNHVVISCMNVELLMAHMENGSVAVEAGERVETGQLVGRVGNSGNTTEPHLHIHAVEGGGPGVFQDDAVPILFRRRLPTRNTLFVVE